MSANTPEKSGFALTLASSELGFNVHAGFLDALTGGLGIRPEHIGAVSSGSYVGGLYAAGFDPHAIHEILSRKEMARSFLEWLAPLRGMGLLFNLPGHTGLIRGDKAAAYLKKQLGEIRIEECNRAKLSLAVTNLTKGRSEIVRSGPLVEFIIASCSVPLVFRAKPIEGSFYCDGAVSDSSPFHHFIRDPGVETILVHEVRHEPRSQPHSKPLTISGVFARSHQIITDRVLDLCVEHADHVGKRVLILTSIVPRHRWGKKGVAKHLFEAGRRTVMDNESRIQQLMTLKGKTS
jgi:predicted acylesterase/phospholipase RssA